ncbi:MAG: type III pantothenate kinase [Sphingomonadales bacterium]
MLLTIDAGNTDIVFAILDGETLIHSWRVPTNVYIESDELLNIVKLNMSYKGVDKIRFSGSIIASVVSSLNEKLYKIAKELTKHEPLLLGTNEVELGIDIQVDTPEEVGADRLVNAISGYNKYGGDLIILDFGTATTFDVVGENGAYLGGVICPGINLSLNALAQAADKLPKLTIEPPKNNIVTGKNTVDAMQSGIYWGYIGLIEGLVKKLRAEHGNDTKVIGTGGLVEMFSPKTDKIDYVERDLTVQGLRIIYERNIKIK